jgi:hypothetical protein
MQAIREIRQLDSETITLKIPGYFKEKKVEIIVLPYSDTTPENRQAEKLMQFDRLVKNAKKRNFKIDKTINVDELMNEMNNGLC